MFKSEMSPRMSLEMGIFSTMPKYHLSANAVILRVETGLVNQSYTAKDFTSKFWGAVTVLEFLQTLALDFP